jgi:hypothetical protein
MQSTVKMSASDPHDAPAIAPDVIPVTWADKVLADITSDARTIQPESLRRDRQPHAPSSAVAVAAPSVDTTFRAAEVGDIKPARANRPRSRWVGQVTMIFTFALVSAFAAGLWRHYGDPAREIIAEWTPLIAQWTPQFAASSPPEQAAPDGQTTAPAGQTAAADQPPAAPDGTTAAAAPAAMAPPQESAELIQSMQRDLAAMGQQIEQLKASIAELKAGQPPAPAVARTTEAKPAEIKPPPAPAARPRVTAIQPPPPPRPAAPPPVRRPTPVQASAAPMQLAAPPPPPPAPPAQATADDGGPVVRPPMSLRWGNVGNVNE